MQVKVFNHRYVVPLIGEYLPHRNRSGLGRSGVLIQEFYVRLAHVLQGFDTRLDNLPARPLSGTPDGPKECAGNSNRITNRT